MRHMDGKRGPPHYVFIFSTLCILHIETQCTYSLSIGLTNIISKHIRRHHKEFRGTYSNSGHVSSNGASIAVCICLSVCLSVGFNLSLKVLSDNPGCDTN
jgi:hypothetical protein